MFIDFAYTHDPSISKNLFINKNHVTAKKNAKLTQKLVCLKPAKLAENAAVTRLTSINAKNSAVCSRIIGSVATIAL